MSPKLPPPDPHESSAHWPAADADLPGPTIVFVREPTPEAERVCEAILDLRPGLLVVCG